MFKGLQKNIKLEKFTIEFVLMNSNSKKLVELLGSMDLINVEGEIVITKVGLDYLNLPEVP